MNQFRTVVLFGDSLTQYAYDSQKGGWGTVVADRLQRKCDVLNRGFSGYNSRWNKLILPKFVNKDNADNISLITIFLGANDSNKPENVTQHVPLNEYEENLVDMVKYLESVGVSRDRVILLGPPPVDTEKWAVECIKKGKPLTLCNNVRAEYAAACQRAAHRTGTTHVELYHAMMENKEWTNYVHDGLHFSAEGAEFLVEQLWPLIEKKTADLPIILPLWDAVNHNAPEESFK